MNGKLSVPFFAAAALAGIFMFALGIAPQPSEAAGADAACTPDTCAAYSPYPTFKNVTVPVKAHIQGYCYVLNNDQTQSSSFSGLIDLGNLAGPNLKLNSSLTGSYTNKAQSFQVVCNGSAPSISIKATSMVGSVTPVDSSYTNVVGYTAHLQLIETSGSETFNAVSALSAPTATTATLAHNLTNLANDVTVYVDTLTSNGGVLTNGNYGVHAGGTGGVIDVMITPNT